MQIVSLCLSLVFSISAVFLAITVIGFSRIIETSLRSIAKLTIQYIDADIRSILSSPITITKATAQMIESVPQELRKTMLEKVMTTDPIIPQMLYATVVSRLEPEGYILYATDYQPADDYDQTKRTVILRSSKTSCFLTITVFVL
ncbi:MAG: hypothetical protein LBO67_05545 [Spirochaetaceae bacterium]|jgi:hypothetical protein|nr:hypothetical protein [Spirochaetaceae bacterium]